MLFLAKDYQSKCSFATHKLFHGIGSESSGYGKRLLRGCEFVYHYRILDRCFSHLNFSADAFWTEATTLGKILGDKLAIWQINPYHLVALFLTIVKVIIDLLPRRITKYLVFEDNIL